MAALGGRHLLHFEVTANPRSGGVLRTVTRSGQAKDYAGICFEEVGE